MSGRARPVGAVFVSYARKDRERVRPLVDLLSKKRFSVWWDEEIEPGMPFRSAIQHHLYEAACVVVVWTHHSVSSEFVWSEAEIAHKRGILVPVLLDAEATIPVGFTELHYVDLSHWKSGSDPSIRPLTDRVRSLIKGGPTPRYLSEPLATNEWVIENSLSATSQLRDLTGYFRSVGEILTLNSPQVVDLIGALREVNKTYRVVNQAIKEFVAPATATGPIDTQLYVQLERGLPAMIRGGKGHCSRILTYYDKYGGLRDWIKNKMAPEDLAKVDDAFVRLGTADGDLFAALVAIGDVLTDEARAIVNLLVAQQDDAARIRILAGRARLEPLERQLDIAMGELQELAGFLGYAEPL